MDMENPFRSIWFYLSVFPNRPPLPAAVVLRYLHGFSAQYSIILPARCQSYATVLASLLPRLMRVPQPAVFAAHPPRPFTSIVIE